MANIPDTYEAFKALFVTTLKQALATPPIDGASKPEFMLMGEMEDARPEWVNRIFEEIVTSKVPDGTMPGGTLYWRIV